MKKKKAVGIAALVALVCCGVGLMTASAETVEAELSQVVYEDGYELGYTLDIQEANISLGNQEYETTAFVHFPNGRVSTAESVVLAESGKYTIEYRAKVGDDILSEEVSFFVYEKAYAVEGNGEVVYGGNSYLEGMNGLNLSLGADATFRYNKVIDVSDDTAESLPIIRFYATPEEKGGRYEAAAIIVRLTDIYDANNYIELEYKATDNWKNYTYITATTPGQPKTGLHAQRKSGPSTIVIDGQICEAFKNNRNYGFGCARNFTGVANDGETFEENYNELTMDYASKRLYAARGIGFKNFKLITDLDEPMIYGEDVLWDGFTTGEVLLTVQATKHTKPKCNLFVPIIGGDDLSKNNIVNDFAPSVQIDLGEFSEAELPKAIIGKKYDIFPAIAFDDLQGEMQYKTKVYYNYNNSSRVLIEVKDGAFIPKYEGRYTVVYSATDSFGNEGKALLHIDAIARNGLDYEFSTHVSTYNVADTVRVADLLVSNGFIGSTVTKRAILKNSDLVYEISDENEFTPMYAGVYTIEYVYSDYVESHTVSYDVTVNAINTPKFISDAHVPRYFIKGCEYVLPELSAYDFSNGTKEIGTKVTVKVDGVEQTISNNTFTTNKTSGKVEIIYRAENTHGATDKTYEAEIVDLKYNQTRQLDLSKYLQGDGFVSLSETNSVSYSTNQNSTLSLVNAGYVGVLDVVFQLGFTVTSSIDGDGNIVYTYVDKNDFDGVTFTLTNVNDHSDKISIAFNKGVEKTDILVKRKNYEVSGTTSLLFGEREEKFSFSVSNENLVFAESDLVIPIEELFKNFSERFYMDISFNGVENGGAAIAVSKLMNQTMSNVDRDYVSPILIHEEFADRYYLGDTITISAFDCYDFVDPSPKITYTVKKADGGYLVSREGVALNGVSNDYRQVYTIDGSAYIDCGLYVSAVDYTGRRVTLERQLFITDTTAPTLTLDVKSTTAKVGETVKFASYVATDDKSSVSVSIIVIDATGKFKMYTADTFTPEKAGKYRIIYYALDEAKNASFAEYTVVVQ